MIWFFDMGSDERGAGADFLIWEVQKVCLLYFAFISFCLDVMNLVERVQIHFVCWNECAWCTGSLLLSSWKRNTIYKNSSFFSNWFGQRIFLDFKIQFQLESSLCKFYLERFAWIPSWYINFKSRKLKRNVLNTLCTMYTTSN